MFITASAQSAALRTFSVSSGLNMGELKLPGHAENIRYRLFARICLFNISVPILSRALDNE